MRQMAWLDGIRLPTLVLFTVALGLAPFVPEPHLFEKFGMLFAGTLNKPIDIFDLLFHLAPAIVLVLKLLRLRKVI